MTDLPPIPPLEELGTDDLDWARVRTFVEAVMASDDELYRLMREPGWYERRVSGGPSEDQQWCLVSIDGRPLLQIHYSRLIRSLPVDLVTDPAIPLDLGGDVAQ